MAPPLPAVAVNVMLVPAQTVLVDAAILILGVTGEEIVITIL